MAKRFDICFVMAKASLSFKKYPAILQLEQRHAFYLGTAYLTPDSTKIFTSYIAKSQCQAFLNTLSRNST